MSLRLNQLTTQNFRCFSECTITFHRDLTVLVADNGRGKTAILDAVATALAPFVEELTSCVQSDGILQSDVRLEREATDTVVPRTPTSVSATASWDDVSFQWAFDRKDVATKPRRSPKAISELLNVVNALHNRMSTDREGVSLPIVVYYGSNRFSNNSYFRPPPRKKSLKKIQARFNGYRRFLDPLSESLHFNNWYRQMVAAIKKTPLVGVARSDSPLRQLTSVRLAVDEVLGPTGWSAIDWDEKQQCVVAEHQSQGKLPLAYLSSGVRSMIALTADLAHRCAWLNPHLKEDVALSTNGVVIIDEVDLHLHPGWQQTVVASLRAAFPRIQFILSTHSPQVLSTINSESIRIIKVTNGVGHIVTPSFQTRGVLSADVMTEIMGIDPVPRVEEAEMLNRYRDMIEGLTHESEEGLELRGKLIHHFRQEHPLILECDRLIRFVMFKRRTSKGDV